jgi:DNA-binding Xre family transcriptional regulator
VSYHWHLRRLMADRDMYATTALAAPLAERGISLSREQIYRLVTGTPERLSLATLAALCDILACGPGDIIEPVVSPDIGGPRGRSAGQRPRPLRARVPGAQHR